MSFAHILWASLAQQYSHLVCTAPMDRGPRRPKQQHDMTRLQQHPPHSHQSQYLDSQADGEDGVNAAQTAQGCSEWTNGHGYAADQHARYGVTQMAVNASPSESMVYWQAQQAQPQYGRQSQHDGCVGQQTYTSHAQYDAAAHSSYLSPDGVPFDLREGNTQGQGDLETAGPYNDGRPIYTGPRSGSYKVFYGAYKPPDKEPVSSGRPPFDAQKAAVDSASKNLLYYGDNTDEEKPKTALVRYSPEPSIPRARTYRGRKEDEYLQWDEQYGFGFAVSPPRNQSLRAVRSRPSDDHREHYLQQYQSPREGPSRRSELPWQPAFHGVQASRTLRLTSDPPPVSQKPIQLFEHSVDSGGILQTTTQVVPSESTAQIHGLRRSYGPGYHSQRLAEAVPDPHKQHVLVIHLRELVEGIPLPADDQGAFDTACDQGLHKRTTQTKDEAVKEQAMLESKLSGYISQGSREELTRLSKKALPSKPRVHRRTMTSSMSASPPSNRAKGSSILSPNSSSTQPKPAAGLTTTSSRTTGRWDNFAARITQDDKMMAEKAREDLRRLEGDTFRPEVRETYKDKKGKKETVVHKTVGGSASAGPTKRQGGGKGEKYTGDAGVAVDEAYDSDSSDGGIALSPSDLDPDSWVVIKTGDEHKGWK